MGQEQLRRMLSESAAHIDVGPMPLRTVARRRRARRPLVLGAAVLGVIALIVGVRLSSDGDRSTVPEPAGRPLSDALLTAAPADPGGAIMLALVAGEVAVDERGCVVLDRGVPADRIVPVWPHGWYAVEDAGALVLRDGAGEVVVREGDYIESAGGFVPVPEGVEGRCLAGAGDRVALVQGEVEVMPGVAFPIQTSDWVPGSGGDRALLRGVLRRTEPGCTFIGDTAVRWPSGFTAYEDDRGVLGLYDESGALVAREGDRVSVGGGAVSLVADNVEVVAGCVGVDAEAFVVQSGVEVS